MAKNGPFLAKNHHFSTIFGQNIKILKLPTSFRTFSMKKLYKPNCEVAQDPPKPHKMPYICVRSYVIVLNYIKTRHKFYRSPVFFKKPTVESRAVLWLKDLLVGSAWQSQAEPTKSKATPPEPSKIPPKLPKMLFFGKNIFFRRAVKNFL